MARLPLEMGGWFKLWGKQWLLDEKLRSAGELLELAYFRTLCVANLKVRNGVFVGDLEDSLTPEEICKRARIDRGRFEALVSLGFLAQNPVSGAFYIVNWGKHQNRESKKYPERLEKQAERVGMFQAPKKTVDTRIFKD